MSAIITIPPDSDFTLDNLPYGIYSTAQKSPRVGVAIGDQILDLNVLFEKGYFEDILQDPVFGHSSLNAFIALGKSVHQAVRQRMYHLLTADTAFLEMHQSAVLDNRLTAALHMPVEVGDYTDFYSSEEHASNVGRMFRPTMDPLLPNWKHMPIAYHGRSSSIITTNTQVKRPKGQILKGDEVVYAPSQTLDIEIELGYIIGKSNALGEPVDIQHAREYVFGAVILNDFSARDIQRWEYQPLGPFLGKNFATAISPWVVLMEALEAFTTEAPAQDVPVLPYLQQTPRRNFDIELSFTIETAQHQQATVAVTNARYLYWTIEQQIAHHTVNGCNLRIGDLLGTGTISGKEKGSFGSLLELTWNGKEKIKVGNEERMFLEDGDTTILRAVCKRGDKRIGFGEVRNKIMK